MLEVHVLASGSDGNCIVVQLDDEAVMIDAGLSYKYTHKLMELEVSTRVRSRPFS